MSDHYNDIHLSAFFPAAIHFFFTGERMGAETLPAAEWELAKEYGVKRLADFATGRYCLRQSTAPLGFAGDILKGERGMPVLPPHIAGTISHTKEVCGAIACHKSDYLSVGMDIELCGRVTKELWRLLFTRNEIEYLEQADTVVTGDTATIFFSLKEAFYKMQFPLTTTFLDFHDVEISIDNGLYYVMTLKQVGTFFSQGQLTPGQVLKHNGHIIAYCTYAVE